MEFKNVDSLSITECCEYLKINRQNLPEAIQNLKDLKGLDMLVVSRLIFLIDTDKAAVESCGSIEQYEKYLSTWPDGLYHLFAKQRIDQLRAESEELDFYKKYKGSSLGRKKYLKKYPNGKYSREIRAILRRKKRVRNVIVLISFLIAVGALALVGIFSYEPLPTIDIPEEINVSQYGDTIRFDQYIKNVVNDDNIYVTLNGNNRQLYAIEKGKVVYRNDGHEYIDLDTLSSSDYINLDWPDILSWNEEYVIPMNASSHEQIREICITSVSKLFGFVIQERTDVVRIRQQPGLATYLSCQDRMGEWCYEMLSTNKGQDGNKTINILVSNNGIQGNTFPIFLATDGTYISVENLDPSWMSVEKRSDVHGDSFPFHIRVSENRSAQNRTGSITFSCGDKYIKFVLEQKSGYASYFDVEKDEVFLNPKEVWNDWNGSFLSGSHYALKINTDGVWNYEQLDGHDWLKVRKGVYDDEIEYQVKENNCLGYREARIIISTVNMGSKTILITQRSY